MAPIEGGSQAMVDWGDLVIGKTLKKSSTSNMGDPLSGDILTVKQRL